MSIYENEYKDSSELSPKELLLMEDFIKTCARMFIMLRGKNGWKFRRGFAFDNDINEVVAGRLERGEVNINAKNITRMLANHNLTLEDFSVLLLTCVRD